jgi:hypothetical protein
MEEEAVPSEVERLAQVAASLLRVSGHEVQLTRALGGLMAQDPRLAHKMLDGLLDTAGRSGFVLPENLSLDAEAATTRSRFLRGAEPGRIDWRFFDADAGNPEMSRFQVLVEVKVNSAFGPEQLQRYLADPLLSTAGAGGLIALTRNSVDIPDQAG